MYVLCMLCMSAVKAPSRIKSIENNNIDQRQYQESRILMEPTSLCFRRFYYFNT